MGYGLRVFLLAVGSILAFAVQDAISGVDLTMVGDILAGVGRPGNRGHGDHTQPVTGCFHGGHDHARGRNPDHDGTPEARRPLRNGAACRVTTSARS